MFHTAIILAGGFGTRLQSVVKDVPKPMAPVNGIPFLTYQLKYLKHYGIRNVIISVGYMADAIVSMYGSSYQLMRISYVREDNPLGTGGAVRLALRTCGDSQVLVVNGDSFFDVDLTKFKQLHDDNYASASVALRAVEDTSRYGTIQLEENFRIQSFTEKTGDPSPGLINGGIYALKKSIFFDHTPSAMPFSIEKDFFERHSGILKFCGFAFDNYFIDIGVPEDYNKAQDDFKEFKYK
jgi:D-glycero-alpha-D-manno-heptose 1-phosphate guanylyltransferase